MKNRQGSILILTLIVLAILMIFGTFTLSLAATENGQALNHQYKTQAYYIARAGAEAVETAILGMSSQEIEALVNKLNTDNSVNIDKISIQTEEGDAGKAYVSLSLGSGNKDLIINSLGKIITKTGKEVKNTVTKVMGGIGEFDFRFAIFAIANNIEDGGYAIDVSGGATFKTGDGEGVGTNGSVNIKTDGKYTYNPEKEPMIKTVDITNSSVVNIDKKGDSTDSFIENLRNDRDYRIEYEEVSFPEIPSHLTPRENLTVDKGSSITIDENGSYNEIDVRNGARLIIDANKKDIVINVKDFIIGKGNSNAGTATVEIKGDKKVSIYIEKADWKTGSSIKGGDESLIDIYYYGGENFILKNSVNVKFNLYVKEADLELHSSSRLIGNILSNGGKIEINNQIDKNAEGPGEFKGFLYAPNAHVETRNKVEIHGAIICDSIALGRETSIIYDREYIDWNYINTYIKPIISGSGYMQSYYK